MKLRIKARTTDEDDQEWWEELDDCPIRIGDTIKVFDQDGSRFMVEIKLLPSSFLESLFH